MGKGRIYTKSGDGGATSLVGGKRVPKTHPRIEAYGTVDELNSFIGLLREELDSDHNQQDRQILLHIQNDLFSVGCSLATEGSPSLVCVISECRINELEKEIDRLDEQLPPLRSFILPGGCKTAAMAHVCRTICRRAERIICQLKKTEMIDSLLLNYVNRLSDYFFVLARKECVVRKVTEITWHNPCR